MQQQELRLDVDARMCELSKALDLEGKTRATWPMMGELSWLRLLSWRPGGKK